MPAPEPISTPPSERISAIVPARNEENTIDGVLRNLVALDYPNLEVIAIDDRSEDRTVERMDAFAAGQNNA